MNILMTVRDMLQYLAEAAGRIFEPSKDEYPAIGIQPFDGEPYSKWVESSK